VSRTFTLDDLHGGARLATDAVVGVVDVVEAAHATVARPFGRPRRARGIAGWVYRAIRATAAWIGRGLDGASAMGRPVSAARGGGESAPEAPAREAIVAALNGVLGDALAARGNPLATPMHLRHDGRPLPLDAPLLTRAVPEPSATILVQVHGLCMHDGQWGGDGPDPGAALAEGLGATLISLRYNSGRHISENGRDFADALDALIAAWPRAVRRLVVVGHSMGGLVARSAFHYGAEAGHAWPTLDAALVTLGSPHHGAPLERLGNLVESLLGVTRYAAPFARIGQVRSAGVTDLRFGNVLDEDWAGRGRFDRAGDARRPLPLPSGVACYLVGATTGGRQGGWGDRWLGDGLVPLESALGRHPDPARALDVSEDRRWVAVGMSHLDLLRRPEVTARLLAWLAPPAA
jgi:hypothetical protein